MWEGQVDEGWGGVCLVNETCASIFTYLPAWSYPGKVQEAKLDGTFHLWKWVQDSCQMAAISIPSSLPYITTPPQLLIATP